jgi:hypothetical protein
MLAHIHPSPLRFTCGARPEFNGSATPARCPRPAKATTLQSPTDSLGVDSQPLGHVFLVDTFCNLCFDIHPVLLLEHRLPPDLLGVSEGIPSCSLRGTFYFGVLYTFITGGDTLSGCYLARGGVYRYLARMFHESPAATEDMAVPPGVLGCSFGYAQDRLTLRRTV